MSVSFGGTRIQSITLTAVAVSATGLPSLIGSGHIINATSSESSTTLDQRPDSVIINNISLTEGVWTNICSVSVDSYRPFDGNTTIQVKWSGTIVTIRQQLAGTTTGAWTITAPSYTLTAACHFLNLVTNSIFIKNGVEYPVHRIVYNDQVVFSNLVVEPPVLEIDTSNWGYNEFGTYITNPNNYPVEATGMHWRVDGEDFVNYDETSFSINIPANTTVLSTWSTQPASGEDYLHTSCQLSFEEVISQEVSTSILFKLVYQLQAPVLETSTVTWSDSDSVWSLELEVSNPNDIAVQTHVCIYDAAGGVVVNQQVGTMLAQDTYRVFNITGLSFETSSVSKVQIWFTQTGYPNSEIYEYDETWS